MHKTTLHKKPPHTKTKWCVLTLFALGCITLLKQDTPRPNKPHKN